MKTFVLNQFGTPIAVITLKSLNEEELKAKLAEAIKVEVDADADSQFSLRVGRLGDYGETTNLSVDYVQDGELIQQDDSFNCVLVVTY